MKRSTSQTYSGCLPHLLGTSYSIVRFANLEWKLKLNEINETLSLPVQFINTNSGLSLHILVFNIEISTSIAGSRVNSDIAS